MFECHGENWSSLMKNDEEIKKGDDAIQGEVSLGEFTNGDEYEFLGVVEQ